MLHCVTQLRHGAKLDVFRSSWGATAQSHNSVSFAICLKRKLCVLAIETSCDDTCVAVLEKGMEPSSIHGTSFRERLATLHFNEKITSDNKAYKGIHPLEALDSHRANLAKLVAKSISHLPQSRPESKEDELFTDKSGTRRRKPDFIAATRGPGMRSNLSCGLEMAKGLAIAWNVPLVGVHHMLAHTLTPRLVMAISTITPTESLTSKVGAADDERIQGQIDSPEVRIQPDYPFLTLLISGGHTMLVHSKGLTNHITLANTKDIAIGDALDKIGRIVLPPEILESAEDTAYAKHLSTFAFQSPDLYSSYPIPKSRKEEMNRVPNEFGWFLQTPMAQTRDVAFSFSGMLTRVENLWDIRNSQQTKGISDAERLLFARTALGTACEHLASRLAIAIQEVRREHVELRCIVVSGGVAASPFVRHYLREFLHCRGFGDLELLFPPTGMCTDNAAMIAWAGVELYEAGFRSDLGCRALRKWSMDPSSADGGIAGIEGWEAKPLEYVLEVP